MNSRVTTSTIQPGGAAVNGQGVNQTEIAEAIRLFIPEGGVAEIRALKVTEGRYTRQAVSGYFDDLDEAKLRRLDFLTPRTGHGGELVIPVDELGALGAPAE